MKCFFVAWRNIETRGVSKKAPQAKLYCIVCLLTSHKAKNHTITNISIQNHTFTNNNKINQKITRPVTRTKQITKY